MTTVTTRRLAVLTTSAALGLTLATGPSAYAADTDGIRDGQLNRLTEAVHDKGAIGVTAELVTPDGVWRGAAGSGELQPQLAASEQAHFRAASVSKSLVAVLALQLVEQGQWSLDTTLGEVLPDLWPGQEDVTLRQLLSHTSGLPDYLAPLVADVETIPQFKAAISRTWDDAGLVAVAQAQPLTQRGVYSYSNTNFVIVGMMLEQATGESVAELVQQRIFDPAGMSESSWPTTRAMPGPRLKEYARLFGKVVSLASFEPTMFSSAGSLLTTAGDLNRFQLALSSGELISGPLLDEMRSFVSGGGDTAPEYGLGSYRLPDPCDPGGFVYGHDGGSWATFTLSYASPSGERRVAVSMTGRDYDGNTSAFVALNRLAYRALAQTCGGVPVQTAGAARGTGPVALP